MASVETGFTPSMTGGVDWISGGILNGSPKRGLKQLRTYSDRTFTNHWMSWMRIGELPHNKVMKSMELFATHVMPQFKDYMPDQSKYPRED